MFIYFKNYAENFNSSLPTCVIIDVSCTSKEDPVWLTSCSVNVFFERGIALGLSSECQSILYVLVL